MKNLMNTVKNTRPLTNHDLGRARGADAMNKRPLLQAQLDELDKEIQYAEDSVNSLTERLSPIMMPSDLIATKDEATEPTLLPPVLARLRAQIERARKLNRMLLDISSRLEV